MEKYLRSGTMFVVLAFILWGLTPLYYQYLSGGNLAQILIYRVFWSIPLLLAVRLLFRQRTRFHDAWKDKKSFFFCMIAGLLMTVSWSSFIYALTHHLVLDASLGYFINPLFVIALGCIFLKEKLSLFQAIAVFFRCLRSDFSNYHATAFPGAGANHGIIICAIWPGAKVYTL
ncbi:putative integral membrane protein [Salmonella enterica subsp. enterica]|uniref:Putative integral membrane protein n=1 Tax=Salmonella enterica I TaxID=59201 RepID=A0A379W502_SALET|nr:putative integral membrane protein [Salmonella enterica subsp. enterica]